MESEARNDHDSDMAADTVSDNHKQAHWQSFADACRDGRTITFWYDESIFHQYSSKEIHVKSVIPFLCKHF